MAKGIARATAFRREKSHKSPPGGIDDFSILAASAKAQPAAAVTSAPHPGPCRISHSPMASNASPLAGHKAERLSILAGSGFKRRLARREAIRSSGVDSTSNTRPAPSQPRLKQKAPPRLSPSAAQIS